MKINKTVTIVAYLDTDDVREMMNNRITSADYYKMREYEHENRMLIYPNEGIKIDLDEDQFKKLKDEDIGNGRIKREKEVSKSYSYSSSIMGSDLIKDILGKQVINGFLVSEAGITKDIDEYKGRSYIDREDRCASVYGRTKGDQRMLKPIDEIEGEDDMYVEDDDKLYNALRIRFEIEGEEDVVSGVEDIIPEVIKELSKDGDITRIKMSECEEITKGKCLNI